MVFIPHMLEKIIMLPIFGAVIFEKLALQCVCVFPKYKQHDVGNLCMKIRN